MEQVKLYSPPTGNTPQELPDYWRFENKAIRKDLTEIDDAELQNEFVLLMSNYNSFQKKARLDIIRNDDLIKEKNRIVYRLLSFIDEISELKLFSKESEEEFFNYRRIEKWFQPEEVLGKTIGNYKLVEWYGPGR